MSKKEIDRLELVGLVSRRKMSQSAAATLAGVSSRQIRRWLVAFEKDGVEGLISKRRGQRSNRSRTECREQCTLLIREKYEDFGPTLAHEKLTEDHGISVGRETLRKWMTEEGLWVPHKRRRARIQQPRLRRECFGELVQIDGSGHDWFEGRGPRCTLLVFVDDATGNLLHLSFAKSESTHSYFRAVRAHLERYGKPVAYYTDKHSVFRATAREPRGGRTATQFGRALGDLNIDLLHADTPQAKGKVERANGVLQDRLVKELRLRNISDIDSANAYVREFAEKYNAKFGKEPKLNKDLHRPLLEVENLNDILAIQVERKVGHQLTINHDKRQILLEPNERSMEARGRTVVLYERENRAIEVRFNGSTLAQREMTERRSRNTGDVVAPRNLTQKLREIRRRQVWEEHRRHQERRAALAPRSAFEDRDVREEDSFSAELQ